MCQRCPSGARRPLIVDRSRYRLKPGSFPLSGSRYRLTGFAPVERESLPFHGIRLGSACRWSGAPRGAADGSALQRQYPRHPSESESEWSRVSEDTPCDGRDSQPDHQGPRSAQRGRNPELAESLKTTEKQPRTCPLKNAGGLQARQAQKTTLLSFPKRLRPLRFSGSPLSSPRPPRRLSAIFALGRSWDPSPP